MTKDILVDNCVAKNFCNPLSAEYKEFVEWIRDTGCLVVTHTLLGDYNRATAQSASRTNICFLVGILQRDGRLRFCKNRELAEVVFPKRVLRKLRCNAGDRDQLKAIVLSDRKLAITLDDNFTHDVNNLPGINGRAAAAPSLLPYR